MREGTTAATYAAAPVFLFGERARDRFGEAEIMKRGQLTSFLLCRGATERREWSAPESA
jgi:hypothetical protein